MSEMLIDSRYPQETRIAIVTDGILNDLQIQRETTQDQRKGNIYRARITRVEPSLNAAFVEYGQDRQGFLPFKEVSEHYYPKTLENQPSIRQVLSEGQELLIQVVRDERGNKGAAVTTYISLAGSYLVLMPNNPQAGGVSRRIEGADRQNLKDALSTLTIPSDMGVIIRTAGVGKSQEELQWDLDYLKMAWEAIKEAGNSKSAPFLVYEESDIIVKTLRDYLKPEINKIVVDGKNAFDRAQQYLSWLRPNFASHIQLHEDKTPLFSHVQIEHQINSIFQREVRLPSGGSIVIDQTEALVAIDINSAQATKGGDIEETALNTNLEAANEIARQLRLRDLGGLIVIDFIDMGSNKHQRDVEEQLLKSLGDDRARVQLGRISRFGLLEMSRQRLRSPTGEGTYEICQHCQGTGHTKGIESISLSILRSIEEQAINNPGYGVQLQASTGVGTYLLNEKRSELAQIESTHATRIIILPLKNLSFSEFHLSRFKINDHTNSYQCLQKAAENEKDTLKTEHVTKREEPLLKNLIPQKPAPMHQTAKTGIIKAIVNLLFGKKKTPQPKKNVAQKKRPPHRNNKQRNQQRRHGDQRNTNSNTSSQRRQHNNQNNNRRNNTRNANDNNQRRNNQVRRERSQNTNMPPKPKNEPILPKVIHQDEIQAAPKKTESKVNKKPISQPVFSAEETSKYNQVETNEKNNSANAHLEVSSKTVEIPAKRRHTPKPSKSDDFVMIETQGDTNKE